MNVEADALLRIPWENVQVDHMEPLVVKTMLQSKLGNEMGPPDENPPVNLILKSMMVDSSPKLTQDDWVKEQTGDLDISLMIQLLKTNELNKYVAKETDSSGT